MPIDIENDQLLTLGQACRKLPSKPSPATLWRWRTRGVRIGDDRIKLECIRVGRKWYTTATAFAEFLRQQTLVTVKDESTDTEKNTNTDREGILETRLREAGLLQ